MSRKKKQKKKLIKINVIFVHGIILLTSSEKLREIGEGRNLPYPFLRGQPLKELSFNFGIEVNLASRRLQCKISPKSMNTAEKLSLHLKHSVYLVSTVDVG